MPRYLTIAQAARVLDCHEDTAREWVRTGRLRTTKIGPMRVTTLAWLRAAGKPALVGRRVLVFGMTPGRPASARRHTSR